MIMDPPPRLSNPTTGFVDFLDTSRTGVVTDICALLAP